MTTGTRPRLHPLAIMTSVLMSTTMLAATLPPLAGTAQAQQHASIDYSIPAGPLAETLNRFADVSRLQLIYDASIARGLRSPGVNGRRSPHAALGEILAGTGVRYSFSGERTVVLTADGAALGQAAVGADGATALETIAVSGGRPEDATYQTATSSAYISQEEIELFRGTSTGDFLKGVPGVMTGDNRNSGAVDINIRGMQGFGRVPVVVDGAQQQNTVYRGYSGVASRNYLDPDLIGGVEIIKGPSGGVYGVGATGGIAHMRTINADDILTDGKDIGIRLRGGMMSNTASPPPAGTTGGVYGVSKSYTTGCNTNCTITPAPDHLDLANFGGTTGFDRPAMFEPSSGSGSVAFAKRWENLDVVAAYSRRKTGNYFAGTNGNTPTIKRSVNRVVRPGRSGRPETWTEITSFSLDGLNRYRAGEEVLNTSQDNSSYLLKGKITLDGGHTIDLGYINYRSEFGELMPSVIIRGEGAVQAPLSEVESNTYTARYNFQPDDNDLINLKANLWHTNVETQIRTPYEFFGLDYSQGYWDIAKRTGVDISNESLLDTQWGELTLVYGGSYTYETLAPPDNIASLSGAVNNTLEARNGWRRETSGFVSSEWKPFDWLKLDGTMRYTWTHSYDNTPTRVATGLYLNNEEESSGFAPIIAATVEPIDGLQFYGRYAEAIRSPSLFESTSGWSFDSAPTLALKPEHTRNWEFGMNVLFDGVFDSDDEVRFKAAYFNNRTDNYLTRTIETADIDKVPSTTLRNLRYAAFKGFEASARYDVGWFFTEVGGIYYTDTEFCTNEDQLFGRERCFDGGVPNGYAQLHVPPKMSGTLTLGTRLYEEKLTLGGRVTYQGERAVDSKSTSSGGYTASIAWEPYTLLDLFATYKISETASFDLSIDNVTDVYYMDALTLGLMPSPGRTVRATLTAKF